MNPRSVLAPLVLALALVLGGCGFPSFDSLPAPRAVSGPSYPLTVEFSDTLNLPIGAKVKLGGSVIGDVTAIATRDYVARVDLRIDADVRLSRAATFQVRFTTPLGENYVAVTEPSEPSGPGAAVLAAGDHVPLARTAAAPTIEDAFASLSVLINGGGLTQIGGIVTELNSALGGRGGTVRTILRRTRTLVADLNRSQTDVDRTLAGLNRLAEQLERGAGVIEAGLETFPGALDLLADQTGRLRALLTEVRSLGGVATDVLRRSTRALVAEVDDLGPVLDRLARIEGDLAPTMRDLVLFGENLASAAPGDYLNADGQLSLVVDGSEPVLPPRRGGRR